MTLSSPLFRNFWVGALALLYTGLTFGAALAPTAAEARGNAVYYKAELAAPADERRTIAGGVLWLCEGTNCVAGKGKSRPVVMCKRLVRELGEVKNFSAKGKALADDKITKCND